MLSSSPIDICVQVSLLVITMFYVGQWVYGKVKYVQSLLEKVTTIVDTTQNRMDIVVKEGSEKMEYFQGVVGRMDVMAVNAGTHLESTANAAKQMAVQASEHLGTMAIAAKQIAATAEQSAVRIETQVNTAAKQIDVAVNKTYAERGIELVTEMWASKEVVIITVAGCGFVIRQLWVAKAKKEGKENLILLSQSKLLKLLDAALAVLIIPTLCTHGLKGATMLWKQAKVVIGTIKTILLGFSIIKTLYGDDLAPVDADNDFQNVIEIIEDRVENAVEKPKVQAYANEFYMHHYLVDTEDIHQCGSACEKRILTHLPSCPATARKDEPQLHKCMCAGLQGLSPYRPGTVIISGRLHQVSCDYAKKCIATGSVSSKAQAMCCTGKLGLIANHVEMEYASIPDTGYNTIYMPTKYSNANMSRAGLGSKDEVKCESWSKVYNEDEESYEDEEGDEKILDEAILMGRIKKIVADHVPVKNTPFEVMLNTLKDNAHYAPIVLVCLFAVLLIINRKYTSERNTEYQKKWKKMYGAVPESKALHTKLVESLKSGKVIFRDDVTTLEALVGAEFIKEMNSNDRRKAARANGKVKAAKRAKFVPWWAYDDEQKEPDDASLYMTPDESDMEDDIAAKHADDAQTGDYTLEKKNQECCHVKSCPKSISTSVGDVCNTSCGGHYCTHWSSCAPKEKTVSFKKDKKILLKQGDGIVIKTVSVTMDEIKAKKMKIATHSMTACASVSCLKWHVDCNEAKYCNMWHFHVPVQAKKIEKTPKLTKVNGVKEITKLVKVDEEKPKKEAIYNGPQYKLNIQDIDAIGWVEIANKEFYTATCATRVWGGMFIPMHLFEDKKAFGETATVYFWEGDVVVQYKVKYHEGKRVAFDSLFYPIKNSLKVLSLKTSSAKTGEKVILHAYKSKEEFMARSISHDSSVILSINPCNDVDYSRTESIYMRAATKNSSVDGNCGAPYLNTSGHVVGFHNARGSVLNYFITVTASMVQEANNQLAFWCAPCPAL